MSDEPHQYRDRLDDALRDRVNTLILNPIREKLGATLSRASVDILAWNAVPFDVGINNIRIRDQLKSDRILCQILGTTIASTSLLEETIGIQNSFVNSTTSKSAYVDIGGGDGVKLTMRIGASEAAEAYARAVGMDTERLNEDLLIKYTIPSLDEYLSNISTFIVNYYFIMSRFPLCQSLNVRFPDFLP